MRGVTVVADLSYPTAVLGGALSFLSPCVLPLVPPYLCYMAGVSADDLKTGQAVNSAGFARLFGSAVIFVLGFSTVFVALGAGASSIGQVLRQNLDWLGIVAGIAIIVMGLNFLGVFRLALLSQEARFQAPDRPKSLIGAYLMGLAFAFGWTPCIGPVLGAILGLAGAKGTVEEGAVMLAFYSAGLGIPFILAAVFSGTFFRWMIGFRRHLGTVEKAMGGLLIVTGILFLTGGMQQISFWLLETFPVLQTIG
ncbi:cytochrome c biogenesis CcdA family protein [Jiella sp. MQZ9-1]|uniref:Cytochrome c biogenesis protein CcdA n=1 Tax=Jiella flava TaxID=2816857 RepID=A0A939G0W2_9HYPH|nr:cytochrome c biogenesis CcdA family protein [Jiella flava]MBO0664449.1 cytochrome c biogenesis protein CcdA [Jiella flava]MCD2473085.1 cytochrome c biogenesis CcdA family protein [Jiella flava]